MRWKIERRKIVAKKYFGGNEDFYHEIFVKDDFLERFCTGVCLLFNKLVQSIDFIEKDFVFRLEMRSGNGNNSIEHELNFTSLRVSESEIEMLMFFVLRSLRDGFAEVDHVDLEAFSVRNPNKIIGVVVKFENFAPPISREEVDRRLGF